MHVFQGRTAMRFGGRSTERSRRRESTNPVARVTPSRYCMRFWRSAIPRQRWIVSRRPVINPAFGIAEVVWLLAGSNDAEVLNFWFPRLPEFAGHGPTYDGAYGYRLRKQFGIDQVRRVCDALSSNPSTAGYFNTGIPVLTYHTRRHTQLRRYPVQCGFASQDPRRPARVDADPEEQ